MQIYFLVVFRLFIQIFKKNFLSNTESQMYTACLMKLQIAVYRPTECLYTRFIKESFRSQLIKGYFTCTVPYSGYTVEKTIQS